MRKVNVNREEHTNERFCLHVDALGWSAISPLWQASTHSIQFLQQYPTFALFRVIRRQETVVARAHLWLHAPARWSQVGGASVSSVCCDQCSKAAAAQS